VKPMKRTRAGRDPVPTLTCLALFLSTVWANLTAGEDLVRFPVAQSQNGRTHDLHIGVMAPAFEMHDLDGSTVSLKSQRGRNVLLFFASDCRGCAPGQWAEWDTLCAERNDVAFIIVADSRAELQSLRARGFKAVLIPDEGSRLLDTYRVSFKPRVYLVDEGGYLRYVQPHGARLEEVHTDLAEFIGWDQNAPEE